MEIIAHRGSSFIAPENTLAAVELAWALRGTGRVSIEAALPIDQALAELDSGRLRVAERESVGRWKVNTWVMRAIVRTVHEIQRRISMHATELTNYIYKQHGKY